MKAIGLLVVLAVLSGCATTYRAERIDNGLDGDGATTVLEVRSYREFPGGIRIEYDRATGQFLLDAGEVRNGNEALVLGLLPLINNGDGQ